MRTKVHIFPNLLDMSIIFHTFVTKKSISKISKTKRIMIIANPIYDVAFKHLMDNERVARYFIETLIEEPIENIVVAPQEYTYLKKDDLQNEPNLTIERIKEHTLSLIRFDFVATIKTSDGGYKKVLIEIQKAKKSVDVMRFRTYLGEQYKRKDKIEREGVGRTEPLPIITIYLLGFSLYEINAIAVKVNRTYLDLISRETLNVKNDFIESLTHDSYVVQIPRIEGRMRTRLEKMLGLFEQRYFIDDKGILKEYTQPFDDENLRQMAEILHYIGTEPEEREKIESERRWENLMESLYDENMEKKDRTIVQLDKALEEKDKVLEEKEKAIEEKEKVLEETRKALEESQKAEDELRKELERLRRK
jgi:hypothetical protein